MFHVLFITEKKTANVSRFVYYIQTFKKKNAHQICHKNITIKQLHRENLQRGQFQYTTDAIQHFQKLPESKSTKHYQL